MRDYFVSDRNLVNAYHKALWRLCEGGKVNEDGFLECGITIEVAEPLLEPRISKCFCGGAYDLQRYCMEMTDGILDFEVDNGNWHYTYHHRLHLYLDNITDMLRENPLTRRAVISVRDNEDDIDSTDPACLQSIQFQIRDGKLEMQVLFRSNDGFRATFMNMFGLVMLQEKIADTLGVEVGRYVHRVNNFHCYPECFSGLKCLAKRYLNGDNLAWNYKGDWDKQMEAEIPNILDMVDKQLIKARVKQQPDYAKGYSSDMVVSEH